MHVKPKGDSGPQMWCVISASNAQSNQVCRCSSGTTSKHWDFSCVFAMDGMGAREVEAPANSGHKRLSHENTLVDKRRTASCI